MVDLISVKQVVAYLEQLAPTAYQESYDNCGLQVGDSSDFVTGILIALDVTEDVVDEAIEKHCNFIVSHHPLIFKPLKSITGKSYVERCITKAIKHNIAIYAAHTNLDSVLGGVSFKMAEKLGLKHVQILAPKAKALTKLVVFVPNDYVEGVKEALFACGAGEIGLYDHCCYTMQGTGAYRPLTGSEPFIGAANQEEKTPEIRLEVVVPNHLVESCVQVMLQAHPYQEPAYDVIPLDNCSRDVGLGVIAEFDESMNVPDFLSRVKDTFRCECMRYSATDGASIRRVALCGGSGAEFMGLAKAAYADAYITGEVGYHHFFEANPDMMVVELGHYESEQYTKEIFYDQLIEKFANFAIQMSKTDNKLIHVF